MISFQQLQDNTKKQTSLEEEKRHKLAVNSIKRKIIEQLHTKSIIREENFGKFSIGDIVECRGITGEIINVRSSYLNVIVEGNLEKFWIHESDVIGKNKSNKIVSSGSQLEYKGYTTKHISESLVESLLEKRNFNRFLMFSFLTRYDMMMEESDINKQNMLIEQIFGYIEKLDLPIDGNINAIDDKLIFEAAQGKLKYSAPNKSKVKSLLESLQVNPDNDKYNNEIVVNLLQMIRN